MNKPNCWEFNGCGREPGGAHADEFGICPAATEQRLNGVHGGKNAGRACWIVGMTLCNGKTQGSFAKKYDDCLECDFFLKVREEERENYQPSARLYMMAPFSRKAEDQTS